MFSDMVELVESLEGTLFRLSSASERIEKSFSIYARRTVIGFINKMGREEYYREKNPGSALIAVVSGLFTPLQNTLIDNKIRYVESLFSMVPDNQVSLFYSELRQGLNYIIISWDDSEQDPKINLFKFNPQKIKNRATYRVIGYRKS
jgi:hypothetical protein